VAGLFSAEDISAFEHFIENVAIADVGAGERNIFASQDAFEAEVGHGRGDDAIARKVVLGFQVTRGREKHTVTIDDFSIGGDEEGAVRIAVEGDSECGAFGRNALLKFFQMERATASVDVRRPVPCRGEPRHTRAMAKKLRTELIGSAVGTIEDDAKSFEIRT